MTTTMTDPMTTIWEGLVPYAAARGASDLYLDQGCSPYLRVLGRPEPVPEYPALTQTMVGEAVRAAVAQAAGRAGGDPGAELAALARTGDWDGAYTVGDQRMRVNAASTYQGLSLTARLIPDTIPALNTLGLPPAAVRFADLAEGLVLYTGVTGSGKTTAVAATIDAARGRRQLAFTSLEDPVEYLFTPGGAPTRQREVGRDTPSFASGMRELLRQRPDVLLIGEIRDRETALAAMHAAESGVLVFATLHARSVLDTVDRMTDLFPEGQRSQIRSVLSSCLAGIVNQKLLPTADNTAQVAACEILVPDDPARFAIRDFERKRAELRTTLSNSPEQGNQTLEMHLERLVAAGQVRREVALAGAHHPETLARSLPATVRPVTAPGSSAAF